MTDEQDTPEVAQIRSNIESWLDQNHNKIQWNLTNSPISFRQHSGSLFTGSGDQLAITLGFKDENISPNLSLEKLRSEFNFIALDRLSLPGFQGIPPKWEVYPQTPCSSFSEGVTLESYDSATQILQLRVETNFFAIYGRLPPVHPVACGRAAPGTYLQVRRDIHGVIQLRAKLVFDS